MTRLALLQVLDSVCAQGPGVIPLAVVDDVQLQATGSIGKVANRLGTVFLVLAEGVHNAKLPLSEKKLVVTASDPLVAAALGRRAPQLRGKGAPRARNLSHDYSDGRGAGAKERQERLKKVF